MSYPDKLDPECERLFRVLNQFPGISTTCSCCGHNKDEFQFWFVASSFDDLAQLSYAIDQCHSGIVGWTIEVSTDCAATLSFLLSGPSDPAAGDELAEVLEDAFDKEQQQP